MQYFFTIIVFLLGLFSPHSDGAGLSRRALLFGAGSLPFANLPPVAVDKEIPSTEQIPKLQPVDLGNLDRVILNEGFATFSMIFVTRHSPQTAPNQPDHLFSPFWTGFVGVAGWLKLYHLFQMTLPITDRFTLKSNQSFFRYAEQQILPLGSAQLLFDRAFPDQSVRSLDLDGLVTLAFAYLKWGAQADGAVHPKTSADFASLEPQILATVRATSRDIEFEIAENKEEWYREGPRGSVEQSRVTDTGVESQPEDVRAIRHSARDTPHWIPDAGDLVRAIAKHLLISSDAVPQSRNIGDRDVRLPIGEIIAQPKEDAAFAHYRRPELTPASDQPCGELVAGPIFRENFVAPLSDK